MVIEISICSVLMITGLNGIFVSVGNYPDYTMYGLNVPECGLEYVPEEYFVSYDRKCYLNQFANKTIKMIHQRSVYNEVPTVSRIFNGQDALLGEAPWNVVLRLSGTLMCGGSLITLEWVLTAAHCLKSLTSGYASAGSNNKYDGQSIAFDLQKVIQHKFYVDPGSANMNKSLENIKKIHDIGMVKLARSFTRTKHHGQYHINSICLPDRNQVNDNYELATFVGFGGINTSNIKPNVLQVGTVSLVPFQLCPTRGSLCQFREYNQTKGCHGDSGGGLFQYDEKDLYRAIIAGVFRGGTKFKCSIEESKQYWTVASNFIDWILENLKLY